MFISRLFQRYPCLCKESLNQLRIICVNATSGTWKAQHPLNEGKRLGVFSTKVKEFVSMQHLVQERLRSMKHTSQCNYWSRLFHSGHILESLIVVIFFRLLVFETLMIDPWILDYTLIHFSIEILAETKECHGQGIELATPTGWSLVSKENRRAW